MKRKKMWIVLLLMLSLLLCACRQNEKTSVNANKEPEGSESRAFSKSETGEAGKNNIEKQQEPEQGRKQVQVLFEDRDLVFVDPEIERFAFKPYQTKDGTMQDMIAVKVPNINIKSEDVEYFNKQMHAFSKYLIDHYKKEADAKHYWDFNTEYRVYQKDDILSVVVFSYYPYSTALYNHMNEYHLISLSAINIDLKTGRKLSDEELLDEFKIDRLEDVLIAKIREKEEIRDLNPKEVDPTVLNTLLNIRKYGISGSLFKLWSDLYELDIVKSDDVRDESLVGKDTTYWATFKQMYDAHPPVLYYSEEDQTLVANMMLISEAGEGYYFTSEVLTATKYQKPGLNPSYEYYAKKLGIDPDSEDAPLFFSGFIGYLEDEDAGFRLQSAVTYANVELEHLSKMISEHYENAQTIFGNEMYLIIPKHDEISLSFIQIQMDEQMKEERFEPNFTIGNTFVLCNISELYGDYEIVGINRAKYVQYRPQVSLKDGKNVVEKGIVDITDILREEIPLKSTPSDNFIQEFRQKR